ncbi:hypothetical protein PG637_09765 [Riemerella anatipestifer]|nr:hypothetical protein [Riemerella anatipestifer]MDY3325952.1 hypothetical protein [Riemerella anatipestifer]MDY3352339.1 hypothetical protein [Riemerella anatipestifer]MDY3352499.1 hypothetical protein [Riemerella anatipestifer]
MNDKLLSDIEIITQKLNQPFYYDWAFWIGIILSVIGIAISWIAYKEAEKAKEAAFKSGSAVRLQSITIELTEIIQKLDKINTDLDYSSTRDFFNELSRKIRRSVAVISTNPDFKDKTDEIISNLDVIKANLEDVRKTAIKDKSLLEGIDLYFVIEGHFSNLSGNLAELCGILEQKTTSN